MKKEIDPRSKLALEDPQYLYTESKNPYQEKLLKTEGRTFINNQTEIHRGTWRKKIPDQTKTNDRKLHVELGCNGGHVSLEWAKKNPDDAFIGIDYKLKQIYFAYEKALKRDIHNLLFFRANQVRLPFMFGEGEIDHLYLFFPDPWGKKSEWKNRIVTTDWLNAIATTVKKGGEFWIKTDHDEYFEWMQNAILNATLKWTVKEITLDLHGSNPNAEKLQIPEVTLFERLFIKDGIKIKSMKLIRI